LKLEIGKWKFGEIKRVYELVTVHGLQLSVHGYRKTLSGSNAAEYKAIVDKLGPKLNAFINSTKA